MKYDLTYLSLGAGVQSSALLLMSNKGLFNVPKADIAIFSDTQSEPPWVYEHLEKLHELSKIPIATTTAGNLGKDTTERKIVKGTGKRAWVTIPVFQPNDDGASVPTIRTCTRIYKIEPIRKFVREYLKYEPRQRIKSKVLALLGISRDEASRMKASPLHWVDHGYPLVDARLTRLDCLNLLNEYGWPTPKKSACYFCPYMADSNWNDMKTNYQEIWSQAVEFDRAIRNLGGGEKKMFLHKSSKPLEDVDFTHGGQMQFETNGFNNECEGMCGV